jgi:hypothetical protein
MKNRIQAQIDELMSGADPGSLDHLEEVARLAVRLVLERAMKAEISELLSGSGGYRNGQGPGPQTNEELLPIQTVNATHPEPRRHDEWRRPEGVEPGVASGVNTLRAVLEAMAAVR